MHTLTSSVCVCMCVDKPTATICCLLIHSHHLISIWIDSCNADSFHPCYIWKQPITASTEHSTAARWRPLCMCVCHSLTADSVTTHPVFLTHLHQNCNLAHWTFKLLDVTSKGIGGEKHYLLLIVTSPTPVKPVFASLVPFYSTCYVLLIILFCRFSEWVNPVVQFKALLESVYNVAKAKCQLSHTDRHVHTLK